MKKKMVEIIEIKIKTITNTLKVLFNVVCIIGVIISFILLRVTLSKSGIIIEDTGGYNAEFTFYCHTVRDTYNRIFIDKLKIELTAYTNRTEIKFIDYYGEIYLDKLVVDEISFRDTELLYMGESLEMIIFDTPIFLNGTFDFILYNNEVSMIYGEEPIYNVEYKINIDYIDVSDTDHLLYLILISIFGGLFLIYWFTRFNKWLIE